MRCFPIQIECAVTVTTVTRPGQGTFYGEVVAFFASAFSAVVMASTVA